MFLAAIRDFLAARTFPERTWLSRPKLFLRLTGPDVAFDDLVGKLVVPHHRQEDEKTDLQIVPWPLGSSQSFWWTKSR